MMERIPVSSSNIAEIGYDEPSGTLEILFHSEALYQYFDVPLVVYEELITASSHGKYLNTNLKGKFRYAKI